jgi:hypothetical protein
MRGAPGKLKCLKICITGKYNIHIDISVPVFGKLMFKLKFDQKHRAFRDVIFK